MRAESPAELFECQRGRLLGLAYRMLANRAEAEDVVQDAWLRWSGDDRSEVESAEAFLVRIVTRLCLDRLKSARVKREVYVGPWLPEPVADADALSPHTAAELADDLSFALLLLLDRLTPLERAAFLLHDIFEMPFAEVGHVLGRSQQACRQLASRARRTVREERPAPRPSDEHSRLLSAFVAAVASGDAVGLQALLREDAVAFSDGGGRVLAALNPIFGADRITRFVLGVQAKFRDDSPVRAEQVVLNGAPGLQVWIDGRLDQCVSIDVDEAGRISRLYIVRNPDKLAALTKQ